MISRFKSLVNSPVTEIAVNILICCWVTVSVSLSLHHEWTDIAMAAAVGQGFVLLSLLLWIAYIIAAKKSVREMPLKARRAIETCSWLFMIYCLLVNFFPSLAWRGMIQASWLSLSVCIGYFINQKIEERS